MIKSSPIEAKELPLIKEHLEKSKVPLAVWLGTLTMHGKIVEVLGGLGDRLARHALWLAQNVENEANGIDVARTETDKPSTDRAYQVHGLKGIFTAYPQAMNFVVNSLGAVLLRMRGAELFIGDKKQLGIELNYFAQRHGLQGDLSSTERVIRFYDELDWMMAEGGEGRLTGESGAELFWSLAIREEILAYFGVEATASTIYAIAQPLSAVVQYEKIVGPYHTRAEQLIDTLQV